MLSVVHTVLSEDPTMLLEGPLPCSHRSLPCSRRVLPCSRGSYQWYDTMSFPEVFPMLSEGPIMLLV